MQNTKAYIMLVCATLFWAGNFMVGKFAFLTNIPPMTLVFYRWSLVWLILLPFTFREIIKSKKVILNNLPLLTLVHVLCTFGLIFILPQFLYELSQEQFIKFDINLGYTLIFLALFPSIGSYYCWAGAVSIIGANRAGIFLS